MTIKELTSLKHGTVITWSDPDEGTCSVTKPIDYIDSCGDFVAIVFEDGQYLEAFPEDIELDLI